MSYFIIIPRITLRKLNKESVRNLYQQKKNTYCPTEQEYDNVEELCEHYMKRALEVCTSMIKQATGRMKV